jgi:hypothetical protein
MILVLLLHTWLLCATTCDLESKSETTGEEMLTSDLSTDTDKILLENANLRSALQTAEEKILVLEVRFLDPFYSISIWFICNNISDYLASGAAVQLEREPSF